MAWLVAPNGVEVNASELDTPILLASGYVRAEQKQEQPTKKTRTRKKAVKDEQAD